MQRTIKLRRTQAVDEGRGAVNRRGCANSGLRRGRFGRVEHRLFQRVEAAAAKRGDDLDSAMRP